MIKLGDKGLEVTEVQKLLSMLGYDLVVDGEFGEKSARSLKAFQKKIGLEADGIAGPKTIEALKSTQKRTAKEEKSTPLSKNYGDLSINKDLQLNQKQYIKQSTKKDKLFIHFTAGGPNAENVIRGWDLDAPQVSTSYVIDGEIGQIHECFSPEFWSFHLGIKGTNGALDKTSIGIEICAWGPLTKVGDKFMNYVNREVPADQVCELSEPFRGYKYFHKFTDTQLESLEKLLDFLIVEYNIPIQSSFDMSWFDYKQEVIDNKTPGIWTHVTVRKDKTDSYPDQRLLDLLNRLAEKHKI